MKRTIVALLLISCASVVSLSSLPARADSWDRDRWEKQDWRDRDRWDNDWSRRDRRSAYQVRPLLDRLADSSSNFAYVFDRELDRSRLDGSNREDRLNQRVRSFSNYVSSVRSNYLGRGDRRFSIRELVDRGYELNRALQGSPRRRFWINEWDRVRRDLQDLDRYARR
jgi:hypothetical protein